jgi:hypothetical protein
MGCERVGGLAKGGAVAGRPETRVDGYLSPGAKKLVLEVSKHGLVGSKGLGCVRYHSGGSMKLNARILHLTYMVYL